MNRRVGRARRSENRRQSPAGTRGSTSGFVSSDAESLSGSDNEDSGVRIARSSSGDDDEDEVLRLAFAESLRLDNERRQRQEEADREARNREEEIRLQSLRDAEEASRREQEATREEEEALRAAVEASQAEERVRVRREREERRDIRRAESRFGSSQRQDLGTLGLIFGSTANDRAEQLRAMETFEAEVRVAQVLAARSRAADARAEVEADNRLVLGSRRVRDAVRTAVRRSRSFGFSNSSPDQRGETSSQPATDPARHPVATPPPPSARMHRLARTSASTQVLDPASYLLEEIISRSRNEAYSEGPFTEEGQEFNYDELQRAINESAEQHRDEEEEAVQRNRGIPTYEEACSSRRYRPRPGMRYSFQGPEVIEIENEGKPSTKLKIVGDMDLGEAMEVANQKNKKRDQTQLN